MHTLELNLYYIDTILVLSIIVDGIKERNLFIGRALEKERRQEKLSYYYTFTISAFLYCLHVWKYYIVSHIHSPNCQVSCNVHGKSKISQKLCKNLVNSLGFRSFHSFHLFSLYPSQLP